MATEGKINKKMSRRTNALEIRKKNLAHWEKVADEGKIKKAKADIENLKKKLGQV